MLIVNIDRSVLLDSTRIAITRCHFGRILRIYRVRCDLEAGVRGQVSTGEPFRRIRYDKSGAVLLFSVP